jgi:tetratricopeptide (TPR) repeat protein
MMENRSGDPALAALSDNWSTAISSGLVSTGLVQAVDVRGIGVDSTAARDLAHLRRAARRVRASSVVWGTYGRGTGDTLTVQIHLTDAGTGQVLRPLRPVVGSAANSTALTNQVQQRVMAGYAAHFDPRFHDYTTVSQPATWEAYREFQNGVEGWWNAPGDRTEFTNHLRQAITLDPDFTQAALYLAQFSYWDTDGCGRTDSIAAALRRSGARLLPYDQAHLDYVLGFCEQDPEKRYAAGGEMLRLAPDLWEAVWNRAFAANDMHRPREVVTLLRPLERRASSSGMREMYWHLLIWNLHGLGQFDSALAVARRAAVEFPDNPLIDRYGMRQVAALGRVDSLNAILERRLLKPSLQRSAGEDLLFAGLELRGHGHLDAGRQTCSRAATWFESHTTQSSSPTFRGMQANALYCAERWTEARSLYADMAAWDTSLAFFPGTRWFMQARIRLALIAARRGDTTDVARTDRWLARREDPEGWYGQAVLAGLRGDVDRAFGLFQRAWERGVPGFSFAHVDPDLEPLRDAPEFRALLYPDR